MVVSVNEALRRVGEPFPFSWEGELKPQTFAGDPVTFVGTAKLSGTYVYDGSLVMGNLMLAAHELNIGSCWIHRAKEVFEREEWKQWLKSLGLNGEYEGIGNCVLGYVDGEYPGVLPRKEGRVYFVE